MHVDVHGETAHAGPTPMDRRRNALIGAAMLAVAVNDIGWKYHVTEGKATVPRLINEAEHAE
jgi:N-carbamoyl-L-amino-acid hydrolase